MMLPDFRKYPAWRTQDKWDIVNLEHVFKVSNWRTLCQSQFKTLIFALYLEKGIVKGVVWTEQIVAESENSSSLYAENLTGK